MDHYVNGNLGGAELERWWARLAALRATLEDARFAFLARRYGDDLTDTRHAAARLAAATLAYAQAQDAIEAGDRVPL